MDACTPVIARVSHRFAATPERVFDALLDVDKARTFMFATPTGEMVRAEIDPRVGGKFRFVDRRDGQDIDHVGEYLEIERPSRIAFTFAFNGTEPSLVEIDIKPLASGCELILTHVLHREWADYLAQTEAGWSGILDGLAASIDA